MRNPIYFRTHVYDLQMVKLGEVPYVGILVERYGKGEYTEWIFEESTMVRMGELDEKLDAVVKAYQLKALRIMTSLVEKGMSDE